MDTDGTAGMHVDSEPPPGSPMSSTSSVHSADFSPVSRASSLRSSGGLSRASSAGGHLAQALRGGERRRQGRGAPARREPAQVPRAGCAGTRPAAGLAPGRVCLDERDGTMGASAHGRCWPRGIQPRGRGRAGGAAFEPYTQAELERWVVRAVGGWLR